MKDFLQKNVTLLSTLVGISFVVIFVLLVLLLGARELQQKTLQRIDKPDVATAVELPGPRNSISDRSKHEIDVLSKANPHILAVYAMKINYEKTENPILHYVSKIPEVDIFMKNFEARQLNGQGFSSAELDAKSPQSLRNTEEAKTGLIKCDLLTTTNIPQLAPGIDKIAHGVCRATIPPFDEKVNLAIVAVIDVEGDAITQDIQEIRRTLLQLQIDIYNRDFQGRETWAHD